MNTAVWICQSVMAAFSWLRDCEISMSLDRLLATGQTGSRRFPFL